MTINGKARKQGTVKKKRRKLVLDTKAKYCIAGAVALLAVLTVVLCAMSDAFDFSKGEVGPSPDLTPAVTPAATEPPATPAATPTPPAVTSTPEPEQYTITVTAGKGGSVSPSGQVAVTSGGSCTFAITPDAGDVVGEVKVDGQDVGAVTEYIFTSVAEDHSLYVVFRADETTPPPTDAPPATTPPVSATDIVV